MEEQIQNSEIHAQENAEPAQETPAEKPEGKGITGSTLKLIAIVTMFIDHVGAALFEHYLYTFLVPNGGEYCKAMISAKAPWLWMDWMGNEQTVLSIDMTLRSIGRIAFPIFCFLLVEGFMHTRNIKKYLLRLGIFALVSDVPFDLAFFAQIGFSHQNVFFTLFIAVLAMWAIDHVKRQESFNGFHKFTDKIAFLVAGAFAAFASIKSMVSIIGIIGGSFFGESAVIENVITGVVGFIAGVVVYLILSKKWDADKKQRISVGMLYLFGFFTLAEILHTDYAGWGVLGVVAIYLARPGWNKGFGAGCLALIIKNFGEMTALIGMPFVARYNGKRGLKMKYFFYAFYPAHLLILFLIRYYLLGI